MRTKVFKSCCALIALRFQNFFRLIAQFCTFNSILFHFDRNIDKCRPSLANYLLFFCLTSQKMRYLHRAVRFQLLKLNCALTWSENAIPQLRNCVVLHLNQYFCFCSKQYFCFTPHEKILVPRLVAFTAADRFFKRLRGPQTKQAKKRCRAYRSLIFRCEYKIFKCAYIGSRTRSKDQFLYTKVQFILVLLSLSAGAPSLRLLWRRH